MLMAPFGHTGTDHPSPPPRAGGATIAFAQRRFRATLALAALLVVLLPSEAGSAPAADRRSGGNASAPVSEGEASLADRPRPQIGAPYPALELDSLDGAVVNAGRVAGRPFVLEFFATWCQPCHRALADLLVLRKTPGFPALAVVLVSVGEQPEVVRRWLASAGLPDDIIVTADPAGHASRRWGARRLPTTFIVDGSGVVRRINRGWGPGYRNRMARWLAKL